MDVSATSALNLFNFQSAQAAGSQSSAVLKVLAQAYTDSTSSLGSTDDLSALAGFQNLSPLVSAIYSQAGTQAAASLQGLSGNQLFEGVNSSSATSLLGGLGTDAASQGFLSALTSTSTLATTASLARQAYGTGNLTTEAQNQATAETNAANQGTTPTAATLAQTLAAAQLAATNNTFTLLA
jgi:hypothetical protein